MDDILHILGLLRERAEADIAVLTTRRTKLLLDISDMKHAAQNMEMSTSNIADMYVQENWQYAQIIRIKSIEKKLADIDMQTVQAKAHYKTILAKHLAAQEIAARAMKEALLRQEDMDAEAQLEVFRQNKMPAS